MKPAILLFSLTLFILFPLSGFGQDEHSYLVLEPGGFFFKGDLEEEHHVGAFYSQLVYGHKLHPNFSLQGEIGYLHSGISGGNDIHGVPIALSVTAFYPYRNFELFIGGGLGIYFTHYKGNLNNVPVDDRDNVFGGHLFIGADYNIGANLFIGIEGKYIFTEKAKYGSEKVNLNGLATALRLGLRF
jgi:opacity protein-like surface antigen